MSSDLLILPKQHTQNLTRGTTNNDTGNNASTNFAPTITKFPSSNASTAEATGNFGVECGRQNMLMSEYYGGDGS